MPMATQCQRTAEPGNNVHCQSTAIGKNLRSHQVVSLLRCILYNIS